MRKILQSMRALIAACLLLGGTSFAWADPIETVGTDGTGDSWANRKYSTFYNLAQGETFHWNFTVTMYQNEEETPKIENWNNWLLNVKGTTGTATDDWFITLRADNYGWGSCYSNADNMSNFNWDTFVTDMNGGTVDMYVNYSEEDQEVRTYVHTTTSDGTKTYFYYNTSSAITESPASVYIALCEQYAKLVINTAEKVTASKPSTMYLYSRIAGAADTYTNAWSASDVATSGSNVWIGNFSYNETYGLYASANGGRSSVMTFNHTANSIQTFDIVFDNLGNTGNAGNYSYLKIGSAIEIQSNQQNQTGAVIINGISNAISDCNLKNYNRGGDKWTIHVEINTAKNQVTALTLVGTTMNGKSAHYTLASATTLGTSPTFNTVTIGLSRSAGEPSAALTSIEIQEEEQVVSVADYTINYKVGDAVVKTVSSSSAVGTVITAETAIDGTEEGFVGNHYLTSAAVAPTITLEAAPATNVLNVPVRTPYTATYRLTKNINGNSSYVDYPFTETDDKICSYAVGWPMYEKDGDDYYSLTGESNYAAIGTFTDGQLIEKTVNYTTAATDVVWFKDINGGSVTNVSYSGGSYTNVDEQLANVTVDAGVYDVIFNVVSKVGSGSNHRNEGVSVNDVNVANLTGNVNGIRTLRIIVENNNSTITAYGNGSSNYTDNLDYVIVRKIMDGTTVSATIGVNGYSTFASPYALDLTEAAQTTAGVKAYKAAVSGTTVTFTELNQTVPANTGILLEGTAEAVVNLTVVASGTAVEGNAFLVNTSGATFDADANFTYYGMMKATTADEPIVFGTFNPASVAIPADKAYLKVANGSSGARLTVVFGDEATGIKTVQGEGVMVNGYYDLQGRRVAQPAKGLYIVNGKKMVVK